MTTPLESLARRVETEEPSRELDAEIAVASGQYVRERRDKDRLDWFYKVGGARYERRSIYPAAPDGAPRYTSSLDSAVSLVPEGWSHLMAWNADGCVCDVHSRPLGDFTGIWPAHAKAPTPAQALTAAALRAIEAKGKM